MKTIDHVLELLYDRSGGFFLLDELGRLAGLSQVRLHSALGELGERGFAVETSPAYGVRLVRPTNLNANLIERNLSTSRIGRSVICFDEVASTNDVAMDSALQDDSDGLVILADRQSRGRGRHGRNWISRGGENILLSSLLLEDEGSTLPQEALTIATGVAVAEAIDEACGLRCELKWPNDVLIDGAKVAGVLCETRPRSGGSRAVVIGVGINANSSPGDDEVDSPATNLSEHVGGPVERIEVVRAVLRRLDAWAVALARGRLEELHRAWLARSGMLNHRVRVRSGHREFVGRVIDVSPLAVLVLQCDTGQSVEIPAEGATILS